MSTLTYTYEMISELINQIIIEIVKDDFVPTLVIGVERGGLIPGVQLSHQLGVNFQSLRWSTRDYSKQDSVEHIQQLIDQGERILLVDDIVDTGRTFTEILKAVDRPEVVSIKTAALIQKHISDFKADFPASKRDTDAWIIFPWENNGFYQTLLDTK